MVMAPTGFLSKLKAYYSGEKVNKTPPISAGAAAALSAGFVVLYVAPFYLSKATRPSQTLSRDAPSVIRARIRAVTSACVIASLLVILLIAHYGKTTPRETLHMLGWWPVDPFDILRTVALCAILFAGPLFEAGIVRGGLKHWVKGTYVVETFSSWEGWRNLVAGPVTEEIMFRSLLIPIHLLAHFTPKQIVFITPLYFGIAHVHHLYEFRITRPEVPLSGAIIRSLLQFTYTSLFGFFAAFVFLRTGSVYAAIAAHTFCNWMGLPRFWGRVGVESGPAYGPHSSGKKEDDGGVESGATRQSRMTAIWTFIYYKLLYAGAYAFYMNLFPLTESRSGLASFSVIPEKEKRRIPW